MYHPVTRSQRSVLVKSFTQVTQKKQHLVVFAWFVLSLQNWIDQIKFWKVTGNSKLSYVVLNTVQSSERAQSRYWLCRREISAG